VLFLSLIYVLWACNSVFDTIAQLEILLLLDWSVYSINLADLSSTIPVIPKTGSVNMALTVRLVRNGRGDWSLSKIRIIIRVHAVRQSGSDVTQCIVLTLNTMIVELCVDYCSSTATNVVSTSHTCAQRFLTPTTTYLKVPLIHGRVQ